MRPPGDGRQDDIRRRDGEVGAVMLPHAEEIETQLIREDRLRDDVAYNLGRGPGPLVGVPGHVAEGIQAELKSCAHRELPSDATVEVNRPRAARCAPPGLRTPDGPVHPWRARLHLTSIV